MAQPNLYYSESVGAFIMEFTTTGQLLGIKQDSDLFLVASLPADAEQRSFDAEILGIIDYLRFMGKTNSCPINSGTLLLALIDLKIYIGE